MDFWLTATVALVFMQASPGPAVLTLVGYGLEYGRKRAIFVLCGFVVGQLTALILGFAVVVAVLYNSPNTLFFLRSFGGFLLVLFGTKKCFDLICTESGEEHDIAKISTNTGTAVFVTWFIAATSPIAVVFYIAFLPQLVIVDISSMITICGIVTAVSIMTGSLYIVLTFTTKRFLFSNDHNSIINFCAGIVLMFVGIWSIYSVASED